MQDAVTGQQPPLRKDAARNRGRIMDAARVLASGGKPLQLNAVAQAADVGVGTVYRHFPTPEALTEALAADQFIVLIREAAAAPPTRRGLRDFLKTALAAFTFDTAFAAAAADPNPVSAETKQLRQQLDDGLRDLLERTAAANVVRPDLSVGDVMILLCGIGYAISHAPNPDEPGLPDRYLNAVLDGVLIRGGR
jgi:AcrR family transcriptional regulator